MFLTPSCGSCEFVANFPELSYLQLGYLATSEVPGARNSVPSEAIFKKENVVKPKSNCWYFSLRSVHETKARALFWL